VEPSGVEAVKPTANFSIMNQQEFIDQYIVQFLASYAAVHYQDACGSSGESFDHLHPIEDAETLAHDAWEKYDSEIAPF
jgi:hypothetical protein